MAPYARRSAVSRQLTADEEALGERTSSFIQSAPSLQNDGSYHSGTDRYLWMKRELEMRDAQASVLGKETALAGEYGDKLAYAAQSKKDADDEAAAARGLARVEEMRKENPDVEYGELIRRTAVEQGLEMNGKFGAAATQMGSLYESPEEAEFKKKERLFKSLKLGQDTMSLEANQAMIDSDRDGYMKMLRDKSETLKLTAGNEKLQAEIDSTYKQAALKQAQETRDLWGELVSPEGGAEGPGRSGGSSLNEFDIRAKLSHSFDKVGLGGVTHPDKLVKMFGSSPAVMSMLSNKEFLQSAIVDTEGFSKALNTVTGDTSTSAETAPTPAEREQAMSLILSAAGRHDAEYGAEIQKEGLRKKALEISEKLFDDIGSFEESIKPLLEVKKSAGDKALPEFDRAQMIKSSGLSAIKKAKLRAGLPLDKNTPEEDAISALYSGGEDGDKNSKSPEEVARAVGEQLQNLALRLPGLFVPKKNDDSVSPAAKKVPTRQQAQAKIKELGGEEAAKKWFIENGFNIP